MGLPGDRPLSALPSRRARVLAFVAIVVAGASGALIGASFVGLQCDDCTTATGVAAVVGGLVAAGGVAVVAVLVLRAMGEWRRLQPPDAITDGSGPEAIEVREPEGADGADGGERPAGGGPGPVSP